ncbi:MAG: acyltransferase [Fusobacterium sp.]|uniref:acyltransferase n=1 Tax=Fusobacterium sp. TaxID=68766 RepID=UPI0026DCF181|nr:acyltransferase [Fusobacterium sp.]MDO4690979.1 acyltransferase [Fusobacterium sp.]
MYKIHLKYLVNFNLIKTKYYKTKNNLVLLGKLKNNKIKISGDNNYLYIGKNSIVRNTNIIIRGNNNELYIRDNCTIENSQIIFDNENSKILIGKNVSIAKALIVSLEPFKISIGDNCMISYEVEIRNTDSHMIYDINTNKRINEGAEVIIENSVWIGAHSVILKGVKINSNSIIAAGSIVSKNVNSNTIVAGNPAKEIKNNIYWTREEVMKR